MLGLRLALTLRFLLLLLCKVALAFCERVVGLRQLLLHGLKPYRRLFQGSGSSPVQIGGVFEPMLNRCDAPAIVKWTVAVAGPIQVDDWLWLPELDAVAR